MPKIPTFAFQPQSVGTASVQANPDTLSPIYRGADQLGQGIRELGAAAAQISGQISRSREFAASTKLDADLRAAKDEYVASLKGSNDTRTWMDGFNKRVDAVVGSSDISKLSPASRDRVRLQVDSFRKLGQADISTLAQAYEVKANTETAELAIENDLKDGNIDGANRILDGMIENGLIYPKVAEQQRKNFASRAEQHVVLHAINTSPIQALKDLKDDKYRKLTEDQKYTLRNRAQEEVQKLQTETYQGIIDTTIKGQYLTQPELQQKVDSGVITSTQAEHYLDVYQRGKKKKVDMDAAAELSVAVMSYDPNSDPTKKRFIELQSRIATEGLLESTVSTLNSELSERVRKSDAIEASTAKELSTYAEQMFNSGQFGYFKTNDFEDDGVTRKIDPKKWHAAKVAQAKMLSAGREFLRQNPKATEIELLRAIAPKVTTSAANTHSRAIFK